MIIKKCYNCAYYVEGIIFDECTLDGYTTSKNGKCVAFKEKNCYPEGI